MRPVWFTDWKRLWKQCHRLRRIEDRLHLEMEVKDRTWCRELLRMLAEEGLL